MMIQYSKLFEDFCRNIGEAEIHCNESPGFLKAV